MGKFYEYPEATPEEIMAADLFILQVGDVTKKATSAAVKVVQAIMDEVTVPGTTYTLLTSDQGKEVTATNASAKTWTVPSTSGFIENCPIMITNNSATDISLVASGTTFDTTTIGAGRSIVIKPKTGNVWVAYEGSGSSGGGGTTSSAYTTTIVFNVLSRKLAEHAITGSATFTPDLTSAIPNAIVTLRLITDGNILHVQDFSAFKKMTGSDDLDNSAADYLYVVQFFYDGEDVWYNVWQEEDQIPVDGTAPTLVSATIESATPDKIDLEFSETVSTTLPSPATIEATGSTTGTQSAISLTRPFADTLQAGFTNPWVEGETVTVSYTQAGTSSDIADLAGNKLANLVDEPVTNNASNDLLQYIPGDWTAASGGYVGHAANGTAFSVTPLGVGEEFIIRDSPSNTNGVTEGWFGLSDTPFAGAGAIDIAHPLLLGTDMNIYKNGTTFSGAYTRGDYFKFTNEAGEYKYYTSPDNATWTLKGTFGVLGGGPWYIGINLDNNDAVESLSRA